MLKKIVFIVTCLVLVLTGCGKKEPEDLIAKFKKDVNNSKAYIVKGNMEILSNEETYTYSIEANYLKDDYYKVTLVNQTNNHEQIILKNDDGVYVVTPTLNKSFKFQSEWPNNSSQSYILSSLITDASKDKETSLEQIDKGYVLKTKVSYPNNKELIYQKIYFDKDMNLQKVEVYDNEDIVIIKASFSSIDLKANLKKEDFALENLINTENLDDDKKESTKNEENIDTNNQVNDSNNQENNNTNLDQSTKEENTNENNQVNNSNNQENNNTNLDQSIKEENSSTPNIQNETTNSSINNQNNPEKDSALDSNSTNKDNSNCINEECDVKTSNILDTIIYPLYIPSDTYLSNSEKIDTDDGNRVILTFAGDKNFVLIEEVASVSSEFEIIPVYGDPIMLSDTIAAKSANSMYWTSKDVSYYLTSNDLSAEEMVTIAESLGNATSVVASK